MSKRLKNRIMSVFMLVVLLAQTVAPVGIVFADGLSGEVIEDQEMLVDKADDDHQLLAMLDEEEATTGFPEVENVVPVVQQDERQEESAVSSVDENEVDAVGEEEIDEEDEESERVSLSDESTVGKDLGDIFKFESFVANEKEYQLPIEEPIIIDNGTKVEVNYLWDTNAKTIKNGDRALLELPDIFKKMRNTPKADLIVEDKDNEGSNINVGTFEIIDGHLILIFNEMAEEKEIDSGYAVAELEFTIDETKESIRQEIDVEDEAGHKIPIIVRPKRAIQTIEKTGQADTNPNATYITWTVDVVNISETTLLEGILEDKLPDGLGEAYDFEIYQLEIDLEGSKRAGDEIEDIEVTEFPIVFENMEAYSGYRVVYKTKITDESKSLFENIVDFNGEKDTGIVKDLIRSKAIEKEDGEVQYANQDGEQDTITWKIWVNKNGKAIENAQIFDELPIGLKIVEDTITIYDKDNNVVTDKFVTTPGTGFPIILGSISEKEQYRIEYVTEIDYSLINDGKYKQNNNFTNTAILKNGETEIERDIGKATTKNRKSIVSKSGDPNIGYKTKEITWTIDVNSVRYPFKGEITVTDTLPEGVSIDVGKIGIIDSQGTAIEGITPTLVDGKVTIIFPAGFLDGKTAKIVYTTQITDVNHASFKNSVNISGEGVGKEDNQDYKTISMPENHYKKTAGAVNYKERTIGWEIVVEPFRDGFEPGLTITDTFAPNDGMIFLDNTEFQVSLGREILDKDTDYDFVQTDVGDKTGFVITMKIPVNDRLVVKYQTSFDPDLVKEPYRGEIGKNFKYTNLAVIKGKPVSSPEVTKEVKDEVTVNEETTNNGKKIGRFITVDSTGDEAEGWLDNGDEKKIAWEVFVNYREENLGTGVVVTDTLQYEGKIDEESVKIQTYTINEDGSIAKPYAETGIKYADTFSEDGKTLTVNFEDPVEQGYVISFTSSVPAHSQEHYTNNVLVKSEREKTAFSGSKTYKEWDHYLSKEALIEGKDVYVGEEIEWEATVNGSLSVIEEAVITDKMSAGHIYILGSLKVTRGGDKKVLEEGKDYELDILSDSEVDGGMLLVVKLNNTLTGSLTLRYKSVVTIKEGEVSNQILLKGKSFTEKSIPSETLNAKQFVNVGGKWNPKKGALRIIKVDSEEKHEGQSRVIDVGNEAIFELSFDLYGERSVLGEFSTVNGILEIENLTLRTYYLREVTAPEGYVSVGDDIPVDVNQAAGTNKENIIIKEIENTKEKIKISVHKKWEVGPTIRPAVQFQLFKNDIEVGVPITLDGSEELAWTYQWNDLDRTDMAGEPINYTVEEVDVPDGYEPKYDYSTLGNKDINISITNTYIKPTVDIDVQKFWEDNNNQDGVRPESITVRLFAGEDEVAHQILNAGNNWSYTFEELPVYQADKRIEYTLIEDRVENYSSKISFKEEENRFEVVNHHTPGKTTIDVVKNWLDQKNIYGTRPESIIIHLLANKKSTGVNLILTEKDNWRGSFESLDTHINGQLIDYTVVEEEVLGYEGEIDQNTGRVTNTLITTQVQVDKTWSDFDDKYHLRPEAINVRLLQNEEALEAVKVATIAPDEEGNWSYTFTDLPKFDAEGKEYRYTVEEEAVSGYQMSVVRAPSAVKNTHYLTLVNTLVTTEIIGQKLWEDDNDAEGLRPEFITVNLLQNDKELTSTKVTPDANGDWRFIFEDLPKFDSKGREYVYTVTEVEEPDYVTAIVGTTITNTLKEQPTETPGPETPGGELPNTGGEVPDPEGGEPGDGDVLSGTDGKKPSGQLPNTGGSVPQTGGENKPKPAPSGRLPQTGEVAYPILTIIGMGFITMSVGMWMTRTRRDES